MSDLLERTARRIHTHGPEPPGPTPPTGKPEHHAPWPRAAKVLIAVFAVAALISATGALLALTDDPGGSQAQIDELTDERNQLTDERNELVVTQQQLVAERQELTDEVGALATEATGLRAELRAAESEVATLTGQLTASDAGRAALRDRLAAAESEVATIEKRLGLGDATTATLEERIAELDGEIDDLVVRAFLAEQARDQLLAGFPTTFAGAVDDIDLVGEWDVDWNEAYCEGFATCRNDPGVTVLTITKTPEGWLHANIDGYLDAGLFRVDGALFAVAASRTATPACGDAQRDSHVALTLYAHGLEVADDGTHQVTDLGASLVVDAPATGTCPAGIAIYGASLVPN